jgi:hypothetical protein
VYEGVVDPGNVVLGTPPQTKVTWRVVLCYAKLLEKICMYTRTSAGKEADAILLVLQLGGRCHFIGSAAWRQVPFYWFCSLEADAILLVLQLGFMQHLTLPRLT